MCGRTGCFIGRDSFVVATCVCLVLSIGCGSSVSPQLPNALSSSLLLSQRARPEMLDSVVPCTSLFPVAGRRLMAVSSLLSRRRGVEEVATVLIGG